jgi:toxin ParE1/3/4
MDFRVELAAQAQHDVAAIYDWLHSQQAGDAGERWFVALRAAISSLASLPSRCPLAPENRDSPVEVRQLLYGERPHVYRILFAIEGGAERSVSRLPRQVPRQRGDRQGAGPDDRPEHHADQNLDARGKPEEISRAHIHAHWPVPDFVV